MADMDSASARFHVTKEETMASGKTAESSGALGALVAAADVGKLDAESKVAGAM